MYCGYFASKCFVVTFVLTLFIKTEILCFFKPSDLNIYCTFTSSSAVNFVGFIWGLKSCLAFVGENISIFKVIRRTRTRYFIPFVLLLLLKKKNSEMSYIFPEILMKRTVSKQVNAIFWSNWNYIICVELLMQIRTKLNTKKKQSLRSNTRAHKSEKFDFLCSVLFGIWTYLKSGFLSNFKASLTEFCYWIYYTYFLHLQVHN